jgi:uncharacterized protein with PQ loop repeat
MLYNISIYLVIGSIVSIIAELILNATAIQEYQIKSNSERISLILLWPIAICLFVYHVIRILIEGPSDDDFRNLQ